MELWKKIKTVAGEIFTVFLVVILIMNLYVIWQRQIEKEVNPSIGGYSSAIVITGSMAPTINVDDFVLVKKEEEYEFGDVIMFQNNGQLVTHRIVGCVDKGYLTKGDANDANDEGIITQDQIEGKVIAVIPRMGRIIGFFQSPMGMCLLVIIALAILMLGYKNERR